MERWSIAKIKEKTQSIKREYRKATTNYYKPIEGSDFDVCQTEKTIVFGVQDHLVYRVYFYTAAIDELAELLKKYPDEATIDILARGRDDLVSVFYQLEQAGYKCHAAFQRYHIPNLKKGIYSKIPEDLQGIDAKRYGRYAAETEAEEILRMLQDTFDPKESHLQDLEELKRMIRNKHVRVISENNKIVTLITFWQEGKKLYVEHAINTGRREYMHCLYLGTLEDALSEGIRYVYTWVSSINERIRRFISRFGYEKEDVVDYIYVKGE